MNVLTDNIIWRSNQIMLESSPPGSDQSPQEAPIYCSPYRSNVVNLSATVENETIDKNKKILIVDDELVTRAKLAKILETSGYQCRTAECSAQARDALYENNYHLVISDINMPGESGVELISFVLDNFPDTAAIMISGNGDSDFAQSMLNIGVFDYIIKPISRNNVRISVANALRRQQLETSNRILRQDLENKVKERTQSLKQNILKMEMALNGIVRAMAYTVETRDPYTAGHQRRVADLAKAIASEIGSSQEQQDAITVAAIIHDLGKISIPAEILSKPTRLTTNEFNLIKEHPQMGYNIIKEIDFPWDVATIIKQHHEKLDGSGYPLGLKGNEILPESRVITVADVVEAMASHRPYRPALGIESALEEIKKNKGKYYDPMVADVCVGLFKNNAFSFEE